MTLVATALFVTTASLAPLNCMAPDTPLASAICADPSLRAADNSLIAEYNALVQRTPKASHAALARVRAEMETTRALCLVNRTVMSECLQDLTDKQRLRLSGAPFSGPGTGSPIDAMFIGREASLRTPSYRVLLPVFVAPKQPGARLVNRVLARYFRDAPVRRTAWRWPSDSIEYSVTGEIAFASPTFVSVRLMTSQPDEDGVPLRRAFGLNQRLDAGVPTRFSTVFAQDAVARLTPICKAKIDEHARDLFADIPLASRPVIDSAALARAIGDLESWIFDASGAQMVFQQGANRFVCELGSADIKPLLAEDVKIWP